MFFSIPTIIALLVITLLFLMFTLEKKGYLLNKKISLYFSTLKDIVINEFAIQDKQILKLAQSHLSNEYRNYKKASFPLEYTQDLISNSSNYNVIKSWCYLFIIYNLKQPVFSSTESILQANKLIISQCKKQIDNAIVPTSFFNYFKI